ncbi:phosphate acetyltransferase [Candidatus Omnitrophota bacterium]
MRGVIYRIREKAKSKLKKIVLPEFKDSRIQEAAKVIQEQGIADILLLTPDKIGSRIKEEYAREFFGLRKHKGISEDEARQVVAQPLYHAAMMVRNNAADGFVAGADYTTPDVARAAIYCLGVEQRMKVACSCFIMAFADKTLGDKGVFVFADCGIVPFPDSEQLASIAISAAEVARDVLQAEPRVALLSYSTKGSASGEMVGKVAKAVEIVRSQAPGILVDGELQADAAIIPEIAKTKHADSILAGKANVLIFPSLDAGNIGYKLVQRLANARAVGPIILGLTKPCSDLSRGCSVDDIVDCVAVTAVRAQS